MIATVLALLLAQDPENFFPSDEAQCRRAESALELDPKNADANLVLGRHLALAYGDWPAALPHLAKGSDETLRDLAARELSAKEAKDHVALAESWAGRAEKEKNAVRKERMKRHAIALYLRAAAGKLEDADRTRALDAAKALQKSVKTCLPVLVRVSSLSQWTRTEIRLEPGDQIRLSIDGKWQLHKHTAPVDFRGHSDWTSPNVPVTDAPLMCLVMRVPDGKPAALHETPPKGWMKADKGGWLELGPNDNVFTDNSGTLKVVIEVLRRER